MAETGYQYNECDHSEVILNVFEIVFALFYKVLNQNLAVEKIDMGLLVTSFPLRYIKPLGLAVSTFILLRTVATAYSRLINTW